MECTITGAGATVWQGTVFDGCLNKKITLRHSAFTSGREIIEICGGNQSIIGRANSTKNGSFISYLSVIISEELIGKTIECANEIGHIVGRKEIEMLHGEYNIIIIIIEKYVYSLSFIIKDLSQPKNISVTPSETMPNKITIGNASEEYTVHVSVGSTGTMLKK